MTTKSDNFAMITNYNKMLQGLEEQTDVSSCDDQKVPASQIAQVSASQIAHIPVINKTEIKLEQPNEQDICSFVDMLNYGDTYASDYTMEAPSTYEDLSRSSFNFPTSETFVPDPRHFSQLQASISSIPSTSIASCQSMASSDFTNVCSPASSQSLQMNSQSMPYSVSFSSPLSTCMQAVNTGSKTRTFVTELAGSGCTVTTNTTNFLFDTNSDLLQEHTQKESLEYMDLNKTSNFSFYDDFETDSTEMQKNNESEILETIQQRLQSVIQQNSADLNIPLDPLLWTSDDVCHWVQWVCHENRLSEVPKLLKGFNGQYLCSLRKDDFSFHFGSSGPFLYSELDFWKSAHSPHVQPALESLPCQTMPTPQDHFLAENSSFLLSPASSPALSLDGSSSPNGSSGTLSQHSDSMDDDSIIYPEMKPSPRPNLTESKLFQKRGPGRGHKKCIALWQFLRRLLLSEQNNSCIRWTDKKAGIFKIEDSKKVAYLWGAEKKRPAMNYDKLSRSVRQYYKKGIIKKPEQSKRLLYQFCPEYL